MAKLKIELRVDDRPARKCFALLAKASKVAGFAIKIPFEVSDAFYFERRATTGTTVAFVLKPTKRLLKFMATLRTKKSAR